MYSTHTQNVLQCTYIFQQFFYSPSCISLPLCHFIQSYHLVSVAPYLLLLLGCQCSTFFLDISFFFHLVSIPNSFWPPSIIYLVEVTIPCKMFLGYYIQIIPTYLHDISDFLICSVLCPIISVDFTFVLNGFNSCYLNPKFHNH